MVLQLVRHPVLAFYLLLGLWKFSVGIKAPFASPSLRIPGSFNRHLQSESEVAPLLERFLRLRVGNDNKKNNGFWYYTGSIRDPVNGREIIGIEGVEKICSINSNLTTFLTSPEAVSNISQAIANQFHRTPAAPIAASPATSYLSHKLFLYVDAQNRSSPVTSFRKSRMAPARPVDPFKELLEWVQLDLNSVSSETSGKESGSSPAAHCRVISTVMWPGGRTMEGRLFLESLDAATTGIASSNLATSTMGVSVQHTIRGRKLKPVNRWLAFGPSQESSTGKSNEVYRLQEYRSPRTALNPWRKMKKVTTTDTQPTDSTVRMYFKRYGLAPAWMAPQRPCEIELYGYRIDSPTLLPPTTKALFLSYANDFFATSHPSTAELVDERRDPYFKYKPWYQKVAALLQK